MKVRVVIDNGGVYEADPPILVFLGDGFEVSAATVCRVGFTPDGKTFYPPHRIVRVEKIGEEEESFHQRMWREGGAL